VTSGAAASRKKLGPDGLVEFYPDRRVRAGGEMRKRSR
jgi:hypothetical protein